MNFAAQQLDHEQALIRALGALPPLLTPTALEPTATLAGQTASVEQACVRIRQLLESAAAPVLVGLEQLTLEAADRAIQLAQALRARVLLAPWADFPVRQDATWAWVDSAELVLCVGSTMHVDPAVAVNADLATAARWRAGLRQSTPGNAVSAQLPRVHSAQRVAVVLASDVDHAVEGQWHALAGALQTRARWAVLREADATTGNRRGVLEALLWRTGRSPIQAGLNLATTPPTGTPDLLTLHSAGAIDLILDFGDCTPALENQTPDLPLIRIGCMTPDVPATVQLHTPGLVRGLHARVVGLDGSVHWLDRSPASTAAPIADPTRALLERLLTP